MEYTYSIMASKLCMNSTDDMEKSKDGNVASNIRFSIDKIVKWSIYS